MADDSEFWNFGESGEKVRVILPASGVLGLLVLTAALNQDGPLWHIPDPVC